MVPETATLEMRSNIMQDLLSNVQTWALILGLLTPLAQSIVQRPEWGSKVRVIVSIALALVIGVVTVLANGQFNPADLFSTIGIVLAASQTAYGLLYKPTGLAKVVELKTSPRHRYDYETDSEDYAA